MSRPVVIVVIAAAVGLLLGGVLGPQYQRLGPQSVGDPALAERVRAAVDGHGGYRALAVAEVTPGGVTWAGLGTVTAEGDGPPPGLDTPVELGSITKTFTGALLADAVERGEVTAADPLGAHVPELAGTPAGGVTLGAIAQHRSGLPRLGATAGGLGTLIRANPYASSTTAVLVADARAASVDPAQPPTYSNLGVALLGTALTRAAGVEGYPDLLAARVTGPLGMDRTSAAAADDEVPVTAAPGFAANGAPAARWPGEGYLPAGSATFATVGDVATWARGQLTGAAPGTAALDPTAEFSGGGVGWAWFTDEVVAPDGSRHAMTWHNGATAGASTMLAIDRAQQRAVVVLATTNVGVDTLGPALLYGSEVAGPDTATVLPGWAVYGVAALFAVLALGQARRATARLPLIAALLTAVFGLLLVWRLGPWASVGAPAFGLVLAVAAAAAALGALRAPRLPWRPEQQAWAAWVNLAVSGLLVLVAGVPLLAS